MRSIPRSLIFLSVNTQIVNQRQNKRHTTQAEEEVRARYNDFIYLPPIWF